MTGEEKLESVAAQIHAIRTNRSVSRSITCPYCGAVNVQGEPLCCETFGKAAMAVIQRDSFNDIVDHVKRIDDARSN